MSGRQLIWLENSRQFVGTQGEGKKSREKWRVIEIPIDKQGLMDYLNAKEAAYTALLDGKVEEDQALGITGPPTADPVTAPAAEPQKHITQAEVDAMFTPGDAAKQRKIRLWSAGEDNDAICEAIEAADGNALARIAEAVVCRITRLAKAAEVRLDG